MPNYEPNFYNNQTTGMQAKARNTVDRTGGDPSAYVLYRGKRYPVAASPFFVILQGKTYAIVDVPKLPQSGKQVTEVRLIKAGEKDYSDASTETGGRALRVYRRFFRLCIEDPEDGNYMRPICRVRNF